MKYSYSGIWINKNVRKKEKLVRTHVSLQGCSNLAFYSLVAAKHQSQKLGWVTLKAQMFNQKISV